MFAQIRQIISCVWSIKPGLVKKLGNLTGACEQGEIAPVRAAGRSRAVYDLLDLYKCVIAENAA
jgi:hypothetical protein